MDMRRFAHANGVLRKLFRTRDLISGKDCAVGWDDRGRSVHTRIYTREIYLNRADVRDTTSVLTSGRHCDDGRRSVHTY